MRRVHVIVGSNRPGSAGRPVADWVARHAGARGNLDITVVDLAEVGLPFLDEPEHPSGGNYVHQHTRDWSATVAAAEGYLLVMPMYNGGFGGALKNAIDFVYNEWAGKPIGIVSYSAGPSGGAPAVEMLKPVLARLSLTPTATSLSIPGIAERVDSDRRFRSDEGLDKELAGILDELTGLLAEQPEPTAG